MDLRPKTIATSKRPLILHSVEREEWIFWITWVLATTIAGAVGLIPALLLASNSPAAGGVPLGAVVGFVQWRVLRRRIPVSGLWVVATIAGWAVVLAALEYTDIPVLPGGEVMYALGVVLFLAFPGTAVGLAQWLILRRHIADGRWWLFANSVAFAATFVALEPLENHRFAAELRALIGIAIVIAQWLVLRWRSPAAWSWIFVNSVGLGIAIPALVFDGFVFGVVIGAITGIALIWLLRHNAASFVEEELVAEQRVLR
jgi:hypothetical protein